MSAPMYRCQSCGELRPYAMIVTRLALGSSVEMICHPECGRPSGATLAPRRPATAPQGAQDGQEAPQGHPGADKGCCTACDGSGAEDAYGMCPDCYGTGHTHLPEQACEADGEAGR